LRVEISGRAQGEVNLIAGIMLELLDDLLKGEAEIRSRRYVDALGTQRYSQEQAENPEQRLPNRHDCNNLA